MMMLERIAPIDPRDQRDLEVLAQRQHRFSPQSIARRTGLSVEIVESILAEDAAQFPREPLVRGRG